MCYRVQNMPEELYGDFEVAEESVQRLPLRDISAPPVGYRSPCSLLKLQAVKRVRLCFALLPRHDINSHLRDPFFACAGSRD